MILRKDSVGDEQTMGETTDKSTGTLREPTNGRKKKGGVLFFRLSPGSSLVTSLHAHHLQEFTLCQALAPHHSLQRLLDVLVLDFLRDFRRKLAEFWGEACGILSFPVVRFRNLMKNH